MRQLAMQQQSEIENMMQALNAVAPANLNTWMAQANLQGKQLSTLTLEEKVRVTTIGTSAALSDTLLLL
jgi:hypothetical protein